MPAKMRSNYDSAPLLETSLPIRRLISYESLPKWAQDNPFIHEHYRQIFPSYSYCFKSIFYMHNETMNIWTHLVPSVFFILKILFVFSGQFAFSDKVMFSIYYISALTMFSCSWLFHTVYVHSEGSCCFFAKFDYAGISIMIAGSMVSSTLKFSHFWND